MAWGSSSCRPTAEETERRCSSMLLLSQHKVQREATTNVKRPKLPLPPHGFHTYEAEYERKTTVTSCIIYLVADIWFQSSCSSISANKPNTGLHKLLPAQRAISPHVCRLYQRKRGRTAHFIQVEYTSCGKKHRSHELRDWDEGNLACCRSLLLIRFRLIGWSAGFMWEYVGSGAYVRTWSRRTSTATSITTVVSSGKGWVEDWGGTEWPVHNPSARSFAHLCPSASLNKSQHGPKRDRLKHGTCVFRDLFCQWRQQVWRDSLCVCGLWTRREKCKDKDRLSTSFYL